MTNVYERKYYDAERKPSDDHSNDPKSPQFIDKNILKEELPLPAAVIYESTLHNNLMWMQTFASEHNVQLAPHGKTTMAPALFKLQMDAGAWGMTLATAEQVSVAYQHGVKRLLLANQLVGAANMQLISQVLADPDVEFYCLIDSTENLMALNDFYSMRDQRLNVLIEIGFEDGRCGSIKGEQIQELVFLTNISSNLTLAGLEFYEGVLKDVEKIDAFLAHFRQIYLDLVAREIFDIKPVIISGAGSAWYDKVSSLFQELASPDTLCLIRPGCYLIHDKGLCDRGQDKILSRNRFALQMDTRLTSSLEVCAYVLSKPAPNRIIVGLGKRDVAFDAGLPIPQWRYQKGFKSYTVVDGMQVTQLMDHHTYIDIDDDTEVEVGDIIGFATSHPCLTLDKWSCLYLVDGELNVVDEVKTYFRPEVALS